MLFEEFHVRFLLCVHSISCKQVSLEKDVTEQKYSKQNINYLLMYDLKFQLTEKFGLKIEKRYSIVRRCKKADNSENHN
jgi:hypothetical protein